MNILGEKGIANILKILLQICLFLGIILLIIMPFILFYNNIDFKNLLLIYPNSIAMLFIINEFIKLFDSLKLNNPFSKNNVKIFFKTACISLIEAMLWILDLFYLIFFVKNISIIFILIISFLFILFFGVAIALFILSELFKQATQYKEENDLTI